MAYNAAKAASNKKSDAKYGQILIKPYKAERDQIRAAALSSGQSLQGYILQAVRERMARESRGTAPGDPQETGAVPLPSDTLRAAQEAAEAAGMTVDQWIVEAVRDKL